MHIPRIFRARKQETREYCMARKQRIRNDKNDTRMSSKKLEQD